MMRKCKNPKCNMTLDNRHVDYCSRECRELCSKRRLPVPKYKVQNLVACICPVCGPHMYPYKGKTTVTPRIFCFIHKNRRLAGYGGY